MTDENTMHSMNDTTTAVPPAPNGHGASNSTTPGETHQAGAAAEGASKDAPPSSKKKKKKRHQHNQKPVPAPVEATATATADQPAAATADQPAPTEPIDPQPPIEEPAAAPIEEPAESLRLRMKIWTDHRTSKRYLMPSAFMRDIVNGQPVTDVMYAYAMCDDDTKLVTLTAGEWNLLPFFYFQEDGPAPRATSRPADVLR